MSKKENKIQRYPLGFSFQNRPIEAELFAPGHSQQSLVDPQGVIFFIGGVHGDEIEGVWLMKAFLELLRDHKYLLQNRSVLVLPELNPDGVLLAQRWNAKGVDLNRNLPTQDWTKEVLNPRYAPGPSPMSEPENKILVECIDRFAPCAILSAHSFVNPQVNSNGPAREWSEYVAQASHYPVTEDIGYPTPGALGTYAGKEKNIPTITLEIERGLPKEKVLSLHIPTLEHAIYYWEKF